MAQGMGAMMRQLFGDNGNFVLMKECIGKKMTKVYLDEAENKLHFEFDNGLKLHIYDGGQDCCETRYMRTDDSLPEYVGATFLDLEIKDAANIENDDSEEHEIQFLEIKTDKGTFTMSNHNEHNGYYGGFCINCGLDS